MATQRAMASQIMILLVNYRGCVGKAKRPTLADRLFLRKAYCMLSNRDTLLAVEHLGGPVYWLSFIRRPYSAELRDIAKEMHSRIFYRVQGQSSFRLQNPSKLESLKEVISKPSDGQLVAGGSEFWIISQEQWDDIVAEDRA